MTVLVIGGGAAGLMAAVTAAERGNRVVLLERQSRVGRKLLATGNGRCNLTNLRLQPDCYHGGQPEFVLPALSAFGPQQALDFFRGLGLLTVSEDSGRVYPLSDQAGSVVDVLRFAADAAGVETRCDTDVTAIIPARGGFSLRTEGETLAADRVILCCGGMAGGKLGGSKSGYELLQGLGHSVTRLCPALVQLKTDNTFVRALKGVRADASVTLSRADQVLAVTQGEVQFTDYGVSGPAIFELSRWAATEKGPLTLHLDLLRGMEPGAVEDAIRARRETMPQLTTENLLTGMLHNRLGRTVLRSAGYDLATTVGSIGDGDIGKIAAAIKDFRLEVLGTQGFDGAQVTVGGIRTDQFDPATLQSRLVPGLYAAGEVLDVDGDCGGYNLQWAWASGRLAGQLL